MQDSGPCFLELHLNQMSPSLPEESNCLLILEKSWRDCNWLKAWLAQAPDDPCMLRELLAQGAFLSSSYSRHVRSGQAESLGVPLDAYILPDEASMEITTGRLSSFEDFTDLRAFLAGCMVMPLARGCTLEAAMTLLQAHHEALGDSPCCGYILVSRQKSFTISVLGPRCGFFLQDTHGLAVDRLEHCGGCLASSAQMLLKWLCRDGPNAMYLPDLPAHVYALMPQKAERTCRTPAPPSLATFHSLQRYDCEVPSCPAFLSQKPECAPSRQRDMAAAFPGIVVVDSPSPARAAKAEPCEPAAPLSSAPQSSPSNSPRTPPTRRQRSVSMSPPKTEEPAPVADMKRERSRSPLAIVPQKGRLAGVLLSKEQQREERLKKRCARQLEDQGGQVCRSNSITFHGEWFPRHGHHAPAGHWSDFRQALAKGDVSSLQCEVCSQIVADLVKVTDADVPVSPLKSSAKRKMEACYNERMELLRRQEGIGAPKKGRRPKPKEGDPVVLWMDLDTWIRVRRRDVYVVADEDTSMLHCNLCNDNFKFHRKSTIHWVLQREATDDHWYRVHEAPGAQCLGFPIPTERSTITRLHCIPDSLARWFDLGWPWTHQHALEHACYVSEDGVKYVRAKSCAEGMQYQTRSEDLPVCARCRDLANRVKFVERVATWAFMDDLARLLLAFYARSIKDRNDCLRDIAEADYKNIVLSFLEFSMETVEKLEYQQAHNLYMKLVGSVPPDRQNAACRNYVAARLSWLPKKPTAAIGKSSLGSSDT